MRLFRTATAVVGAAVIAVSLSNTVSASAQTPVFGAKTVLMSTCTLPASTADPNQPASALSVSQPNGDIAGFASCHTAVPGAMYFFRSHNGHPTHQLAPYRGTLEALAADGTGAVYLSYSVRNGFDVRLYVARRSAQGTYSPSLLLAHTVDHVVPSISLVAANGKWWAVWSQAVNSSGQHVLFEQRTMLGARSRHQITAPGQFSDWQPALGVSGTMAKLTWKRSLGGPNTAGQLISIAKPTGDWSVGYVLGAGSLGYPPQLVISGGKTFVAYPDAVYLDKGTGHFAVQSGVATGRKPYLAASGGTAALVSLGSNNGTLTVNRYDGMNWTLGSWPTVDSLDDVTSYQGHATLLMHKATPVLYLVTEQ